MYKTYYKSPLGQVVIYSDGRYITGLYFKNQKHYQEINSKEEHISLFDDVITYLDDYFLKKNPKMNIPILLKGTPFQKQVWNQLLEIEYGKTKTYKDIAKSLNKTCYQAIGQAISRNPVSILVPCHRVIGKNSLTGYAGGLDKKKYLLELEGSI